MEKSQSVQQEPTQLIGVTPELTNNKSRLISGSNVLIYLVTRHPWLLLSGVFTMFLGGAAFSLYSISHVGQVVQEEPEKIPAVVEQPIKTPSENSNPTPLWMVAAIALSCGSGCLLILRMLNRPKQPQKVQKRVNRTQTQTRLTQDRYPRSEPRLLKTTPVFVPQPQLTPIVPVQLKTKHLVTVLPTDQKHHLDTRVESLADLMDIRKESSLTAILRKY